MIITVLFITHVFFYDYYQTFYYTCKGHSATLCATFDQPAP